MSKDSAVLSVYFLNLLVFYRKAASKPTYTRHTPAMAFMLISRLIGVEMRLGNARRGDDGNGR